MTREDYPFVAQWITQTFGETSLTKTERHKLKMNLRRSKPCQIQVRLGGLVRIGNAVPGQTDVVVTDARGVINPELTQELIEHVEHAHATIARQGVRLSLC